MFLLPRGLRRERRRRRTGRGILLLLPPQIDVKSQVSLLACEMGTAVVTSRLVCDDQMS